MTTLATRNGSSAPVRKFIQRNTEDTLSELHRPIDPRHFKTRKQGNVTLTYVPWAILAKHLHHRAPGWCWEVQEVKQIGDSVAVTGRLTIPTIDGLLHFSAVASEPLESASKAPPSEVAASSCLRRAAALAGLGLELWGGSKKKQGANPASSPTGSVFQIHDGGQIKGGHQDPRPCDNKDIMKNRAQAREGESELPSDIPCFKSGH